MFSVRWVTLSSISLILLSTCLLCACATTRPAEPVKLTIFGLGLQAGELLRQDVLDEFSRTNGIRVELIPTPGSSAQQLTVMLDLLKKHAASPDIYLIDSIWPGTLHDHLEDLTPYLRKEDRDHIPALLENNTIDGRVVSLPFYVNTGMLYYRTDLLKSYGYVSPPKTWSELEAVALRIQTGERHRGRHDFWGYVWQGGPYEGLTCNALEWQVSFGGGRVIEDNGTVSVNNPHTAQAMRTAARWVGSISPPGVLAYTESDALSVFGVGNAAFMRHWSSAYRNVIRDKHPNTVGVSLLPAGPNGRALAIGGFQLGLSRYSAQKQHAANLILYLTGKTVQRRRALRRGILPTYAEIYQQPDFLAAVPQGAVLRDLNASTWALRPSSVAAEQYADISKCYYRSVHAILSGEVKVQPALLDLERSLQHLMGLRTKPLLH